ncbi:MAG: prolyl oligopeptidase family serine peptidase [Pseudomonadota bacterium]
MNRLRRLVSLLIAAAATTPLSASAENVAPDPYLWLEEIESERALDWVRDQNARSQAALENDPRFDAMRAEASAILTSDARIPYGQIHNGVVYNLWKDNKNKRGLWRRASVETYVAGAPEWETVLDYDALAADEDRNWLAGDITCLSPDYVHCMIELSDGGTDAAEWREFNTTTKNFVENGFFVPKAKSFVDWRDETTLLVATDRGADTLTTSGYPRTAVEWARGTALSAAPVIVDGAREDVFIFAFAEKDGDTVWTFGVVAPSFFERRHSVLGPDGVFIPLPFPPNTDFQGVLDGQAILFLREDWTHQGQTFSTGSVVAYGLENGEAELVIAPSAKQSIERVEIGETGLVVQYLEDVAGKAMRLTRKAKMGAKKGVWKSKSIKLPENGVVSIVSAGGGVDDALLSFESLTSPDTLYFVDGKNKPKAISKAPDFYDAGDVAVEQRFATSTDGTRVPYFVMGKKDVLKEGAAPVIQYGYGGFLIPILPRYYSTPGRPQNGALAGKLWVERGGVLVISNIRGGSEYGPAWHQAALKENRQRAFDDFIAISEDLIETGLAHPDKLGIVGRSNGGLLMGAMLTQRPDLYAAIDIGVPLFDMQRYNKLLAGASWMGEYGDPDKPDEWAYISQYSPYQLLQADAGYPAVFFYTSTKDDRVHPGHARKAAAKLEGLGYPFFYYENIEGGHGGTANQEQLAYRTALEFAYFARMLMGDKE